MLQAQIFFDKDDLQGSKPLENYLMEFLIREKISGATAFTGAFGFGTNHYMKQPNLLFSFDDPPMVITFTDEAEKVRHILTKLRKEFKGGLILTSVVEKW
jgi:PII-like signaling protein